MATVAELASRPSYKAAAPRPRVSLFPLSPPPQGRCFLWFFFFCKNRAPKRKPRRRLSSCSQPEGVKLVSDMSIFFLDVDYVRSGVFPALGHLHYVAKFLDVFLPASSASRIRGCRPDRRVPTSSPAFSGKTRSQKGQGRRDLLPRLRLLPLRRQIPRLASSPASFFLGQEPRRVQSSSASPLVRLRGRLRVLG